MSAVKLRKAKYARLTKASLYLVVIGSLFSCQSMVDPRMATPIVWTPVIGKTIQPLVMMTPTPACMSVPGVNLDVMPLSTKAVRVKVTGLNSNEPVMIVFYSEAPGQKLRIESGPIKVDDNGTLEYTEEQLAEPFHVWQIQVIHARGVACTTISLT